MNSRPLVLVVGGASGIGFACAQLLDADYRVVVADLKGAEEAAAKLSADAMGVELDITNGAECRALAEKLAGEDLEGLVHCAGIFNKIGSYMADITDEDWDKIISVNLSGGFYLVNAMAKYGLKDNARIVMVSSRVARTGTTKADDCRKPTHGHYCASKAGVSSLVRSFARELAPRGIRVNGIAPGPVESPLLTNSSAELAGMVPLSRPAAPREIAACVRFLLSEDSAIVTGHILDCNCGMSMF